MGSEAMTTSLFFLFAAPLVCGGMLAIFGLHKLYATRRIMERLDDSLEKAISQSPVTAKFDEAYASQIEEKLHRFLSIQQLQTQKSQLEKKQIKELIATISHQTKTPLTNIILYNQLIQEKNKEPTIQNYANEIEQQSDKMQFFIERLIKTAYLEDDLIQLSKTEKAIQPLLVQAVDSVTPAAEKKQIELRLQDTSLAISYDFRWTLEAIVNVLENAVKYSPSNTEIFISCEAYEFFVKITISDQGIGIPEEEHAQIFERFYRGTAVRQSDGLGIGLYLAREILSGQGGFIKVANNKKQGACFSLFLPK